MKVLVFMCIIAVATCEFCYNDAKEACAQNSEMTELTNCHAKYGKAALYMNRLNTYVNMHISRSLQYLLMSSHFGNYQKERPGFKKLFRKLSDDTWEDAIDVIKYITMRGEKLDLKPHFDDPEDSDTKSIFQGDTLELNEVESLAKAVDIQKQLAEEAHSIYNVANKEDPEMGSYVEDTFMSKHAKCIRELAGYTNDIKRLVKSGAEPRTVGVEVFLLDEYLNKHV